MLLWCHLGCRRWVDVWGGGGLGKVGVSSCSVVCGCAHARAWEGSGGGPCCGGVSQASGGEHFGGGGVWGDRGPSNWLGVCGHAHAHKQDIGRHGRAVAGDVAAVVSLRLQEESGFGGGGGLGRWGERVSSGYGRVVVEGLAAVVSLRLQEVGLCVCVGGGSLGGEGGEGGAGPEVCWVGSASRVVGACTCSCWGALVFLYVLQQLYIMQGPTRGLHQVRPPQVS